MRGQGARGQVCRTGCSGLMVQRVAWEGKDSQSVGARDRHLDSRNEKGRGTYAKLVGARVGRDGLGGQCSRCHCRLARGWVPAKAGRAHSHRFLRDEEEGEGRGGEGRGGEGVSGAYGGWEARGCCNGAGLSECTRVRRVQLQALSSGAGDKICHCCLLQRNCWTLCRLWCRAAHTPNLLQSCLTLWHADECALPMLQCVRRAGLGGRPRGLRNKLLQLGVELAQAGVWLAAHAGPLHAPRAWVPDAMQDGVLRRPWHARQAAAGSWAARVARNRPPPFCR